MKTAVLRVSALILCLIFALSAASCSAGTAQKTQPSPTADADSGVSSDWFSEEVLDAYGIGAFAAPAAKTLFKAGVNAYPDSGVKLDPRRSFGIGFYSCSADEYLDLVMKVYTELLYPLGGCYGILYTADSQPSGIAPLEITREGLTSELNVLLYRDADGLTRSMTFYFYPKKSGKINAGSVIIILNSETLKYCDALPVVTGEN